MGILDFFIKREPRVYSAKLVILTKKADAAYKKFIKNANTKLSDSGFDTSLSSITLLDSTGLSSWTLTTHIRTDMPEGIVILDKLEGARDALQEECENAYVIYVKLETRVPHDQIVKLDKFSKKVFPHEDKEQLRIGFEVRLSATSVDQLLSGIRYAHDWLRLPDVDEASIRKSCEKGLKSYKGDKKKLRHCWFRSLYAVPLQQIIDSDTTPLAKILELPEEIKDIGFRCDYVLSTLCENADIQGGRVVADDAMYFMSAQLERLIHELK